MSRKAKIFLQVAGVGFLGLALVVGLLFYFKDNLLRHAAIRQIESQTGLGVGVDRVHIGLREPVIRIENLALTNTADFGGSTFLRLPELHIEYDRDALAKEQLRLKQVRLHLAELNIVKNAQGRTNILDIYERLEEEAAKASGNSSSKTNEFPYEFLGVDELVLSFGSIRVMDLANTNRSQTFNIGVTNHIARNVKTEEELHAALAIILLKAGARQLLFPVPGRESPLQWLVK